MVNTASFGNFIVKLAEKKRSVKIARVKLSLSIKFLILASIT